MLGIDTNVLIRYLVRDDQLQYEKARRLINREVSKGEPVMVSLLVLLQTEWVLRSRYELAKTEILATVSALLDAADFADCLIEARNLRLGCAATATFDGKALKLAGFTSV
jgi:predicted nucleic-acid-binding protein